MFWLVIILGFIGAAIYVVDKKMKEKFKDQHQFNPDDWDLPESLGVQTETKPQVVLSAPSVAEKIAYAKKIVMPPERENFYKALQLAVANEFYVLTNINAADVLKIDSNNNVLGSQVATKNLSGKQFDFILCDKETLVAVCVIALSEPMEPFLMNACESADLPVAYVKSQMNYDSHVLRGIIFQSLGENTRQVDQSIVQHEALKNDVLDIKISDALEIKPEESVTTKTEMIDNGIELKLCPKCSAVMLKRKAKTGASAGKLFWICSTYPACRGMQPL